MKKAFVLLLGILLFPITVKADVGVPKIINYEVVVVNSKGATLFYTGDLTEIMPSCIDEERIKEVIPRDKVLDAYSSFYNECTHQEFTIVMYQDEYYAVKNDDIIVRSSNVLPGNTIEQKKIIASDDIMIFNGPSVAFAQKGIIPKGVEFTYKIVENSYNYFYVEYNNIFGWIKDSSVDYYLESPVEEPLVEETIKENKHLTKKQIYMIYCGTALFVSIGMAVLIIFINKKRKSID